MREATHYFQLRSALRLLRIADLAPSIGSLLSMASYSSSSSLEDIYYFVHCKYKRDVNELQAKEQFSIVISPLPSSSCPPQDCPDEKD